jgi:hypothetical protein
MDAEYDHGGITAGLGGLLGQGAAEAGKCSTLDVRPPSLAQQCGRDLAAAKRNVARLEELRDLLARNPELQRLIELLGNRY